MRQAKYINIPCSFDIETTSTYINGIKRSWMYIWMMDINGEFIYGRTWIEFAEKYIELIQTYNVSLNNRLCIYVHNLEYEFQFIRKFFDWESVFALKERKIVKAVTKQGVEFRCSYILTGMSLKKVGESLRNPIPKMVGDLDYNIIRTASTDLTKEEMGYCENDVRIVTELIREKIEDHGSISKIPLTKTSYVRNYCREHTGQSNYYKNHIHDLTLNAVEYDMLKRAFQGGFTHGSIQSIGKTNIDVSSLDFTSAYPACMLLDYFPVSTGQRIDCPTKEQFRELINTKCCMFYVKFTNIVAKFQYENYISLSKCTKIVGETVNNGRIVTALGLVTCITELDFRIIEKVYDFDDYEIGTLYYYERGYLPKELMECVLHFYEDKTKLKGIKEYEEDYALAKEMLNSTYGMLVTDICKEELEYTDDAWIPMNKSMEERIEKYNKSRGRFLYYPWGVWVTAQNRFHLWNGIIEFGSDYLYSDTDSLKVTNLDKHKEWVDKYNNNIIEKIKKVSNFTNINVDKFMPKTNKGVEKVIGVWDNDGHYKKFKSLGAKRYMVWKDDNELTLTVSGLNKMVVVPYLINLVKGEIIEKKDKLGEVVGYIVNDESIVDKIFALFNDGLDIPIGKSGKLIHTYIDTNYEEEIEDYQGHKDIVSEMSYIHLEPTGYSLKLSQEYSELLELFNISDFEYDKYVNNQLTKNKIKEYIKGSTN